MEKHCKYYFILFISIFLFCSNLLAEPDTLTQISTIDALLGGIYDGEVTLTELSKHGNFGIGTFNNLDGEMLILDGCFYQITSDGTVKIPDNETMTPFAAITTFEAEKEIPLSAEKNFQEFEKEINTYIPTPNIFYAIKIEGKFKSVKTRSVPKQEKPYSPLKEIVKIQPVFNFENVEGTMVGFRCPPYFKGVNVPGFHLHFLTKDGKSGGHVLDFTGKEAIVQIDQISKFTLILPKDKSFYEANLNMDKEAELKKVEK